MINDTTIIDATRPPPDSDSIPISLVAHYAFCPRRAWLEAAGEKQPLSYAMAVGDSAHRRAHDSTESGATVLRGMAVESVHHGYHGLLDVAEILADESIRIVEYKASPIKGRAEVTDPMKRQIALQWLALEEMGHIVREAEIYFTTQKQRTKVGLRAAEFNAALADVEAVRLTLDSQQAPEPLEDDARCSRCSHVSLCLPDERREKNTPRRITVADRDAQVLHLATYGALASIRNGRIRVRKAGEEIANLPIERAQAVTVHGNVDLTSGLLRELMWRRIPVSWCSSGGRLVGWASSAESPNGAARVKQHVASSQGHLGLAREFVAAKIHNQATLLRRHGRNTEDVKLLRLLSRESPNATTIPGLFGIEGAAAKVYFSQMTTMLMPTRATFAEGFPGRVGRGASDRLNVCLNYVYGLLVAECVRGIVTCGLDPHAGFLHSSQRNKPALALDLVEEFRAPIGDSVVLGSINNGEINPSDFWDISGSMKLKDPARKALITAYERRVSTAFKHPVFGYRVTWRRAIEIQAA
ncbi:MAG: CRISPR-associated endonuclease Cas1 [Arachnia sp.]